jgi:hypothetical protein
VVFFYEEACCLSFYYISISFTNVQHFLRGTSEKKMMVSFRKERKFCGSSSGEKGNKESSCYLGYEVYNRYVRERDGIEGTVSSD